MDQALKVKWVEALRSGQYRQGQGQLRADGNYCCLGVLCEIVGVEWMGPYAEYENDRAYDLLPRALGRRADLSEDQQDAVASLNDDDSKSFPEIADYIEREL